jgi:glycosyltransferase involved in cell wall biosynthesis
MYNLLFLYPQVIDPIRGGVEKVTFSLTEYFVKKGINVYYLALSGVQKEFDNKRQLFLNTGRHINTKKNREAFITILKDYKINLVINQGALFEDVSNFSYTASSIGVPVISVLHNSLLSILDNYDRIFSGHNSFKGRVIKFVYSNYILESFFKKIYVLSKRKHYRKLLRHSAYIVLLSEKYKDEIQLFSGLNNVSNVCAISNPIIVDNSNFQKENRVLYVGRVNTSQKQVDRLLEIWQEVGSKYPDWKLQIIGGGEDLSELLKTYSYISSVEFHGFKNPAEFYKRAKIFCMTSAYEGLPMTLIEAQSYGVVPIAFNTFASVSDIIEDCKTGILISPYKTQDYISSLESLIRDSYKLEQLSINAKNHSLKFDINNIGNQWIKLFESVI